jgi:hypothetical protein
MKNAILFHITFQEAISPPQLTTGPEFERSTSCTTQPRVNNFLLSNLMIILLAIGLVDADGIYPQRAKSVWKMSSSKTIQQVLGYYK